MAKARITEVMMDDSSINVSKEVDLVFSIDNSLRGAYKSDKYKDVIIPMIIIRRFECALAKTNQAVVEAFEAKRDIPPQILEKTAGYRFYNTSHFTLAELLNDADNIVSNFKSYIEGFSANVQSIIRNLDFEKEIDKMDKNNRLWGVVRKFSELDLNPNTIDGIKAGYMFEEIILKFSENAEAGDHYTPREVIRLLVSILLAEGCDDLYTERRVATVLDMACGSGGMLSTTHDAITRMNPDAEVRLFGQEINPESYAICLADMLIKDEDAKNIYLQDTMKADCFEGQDMRIVIINPPFGQAWGGKDAADGVESAVKKEHKKSEKYEGAEKLEHSRFPWGLPTSDDMQLLFMQHAIKKLSKDGRAAIIGNGSPLFSGNTTSGESQIRRYMLENDLVEAIIALPTDLFYNTSIGIYAFILSKNKRPERRGKIQFINAVDMYKPLRKSLGKKRKEISRDDIRRITEIYSDFEAGEFCKIFDNEEFMYRENAVYQPLQRRGSLSLENIEALKSSVLFTANAHIFNETEYEELLETDPREGEQEKKFKKFQKGKEFTEAVISSLEKHIDYTDFDDFAEFVKKLKGILGDIDGMTDSRLNQIAMEMSVMDKTAVVQKDKKGNVITDPTTKDTEIVGLKIDIEDYFKREVYPHVPDAVYTYEYNPDKKASSTNKEKLGAEFPFTRYFYEYKAPEKADELLGEFSASEEFALTHRTVLPNIAAAISTMEHQIDVLRRYKKALISETVMRGLNGSAELKESGVVWFGKVPKHWEVLKMAFVFSCGKGLSITKDDLQDEGIPSITYGDIHSRYGFEVNPEVDDVRCVEPRYLKSSRNSLLQYGDFIFADTSEDIAGSGNFTYLNSHALAFAGYHTITARAKREIDVRFMAYLFESEPFRNQIRNSVSGVKVYSITQTIIKNARIVLPPLNEQRTIAAFLDAQCAKKTKALGGGQEQ
ncbi:hypothetical protein FACS18949_14220 [Clostridia bacterium]|nr:hypothetical protein FACS189425_03140 [Clostridia bacterium]GHV35718.1 hypothetical protein FACS18949_14220 [Clostridia bacterium]